MTSRYVVAVSGGVDSVVLLSMFASKYPPKKLIVAHFDHGIRQDSRDDAVFVERLARQYGLRFETKREELGARASEDLARTRRYAFLNEVARSHDAKIITAHHADDIVETVAINLVRGTGWRGLAVLDNPAIERPLLDLTKKELIAHAKAHHLTWREDLTNSDTKYLRNELRQKLTGLNRSDGELIRLYRKRQLYLKRSIDAECAELMGQSPYSRYFFANIPDAAACELLRAVVLKETGYSMTRPQLQQVLHAVKVFASGKRYQINATNAISFTKREFVIE